MTLSINSLPRDLGGGLIVRRSQAADADALATFYSLIFKLRDPEQPNPYIADWVRDLACGSHPTFHADDFFLVEDRNNKEIVCALNLISQTWSYAGIPFGVGRVELVATKPEHRNKGLVRLLFEELHRVSAKRSEMIQAITGIPYFYRQFGYEMTVNLGAGRMMLKAHAPALKADQTEPYRIRPAREADLPFIGAVYEHACRRYLLACLRDEQLWRYELAGRTGLNLNQRVTCVIESAEERPVGYLMHAPVQQGATLWVHQWEMIEGQSWGAVAPSVLRYLKATGEDYQAQGKKSITTKEDFTLIGFGLGADHPAYRVMESRLTKLEEPYAWYIRVADLPTFLRHIAPAIEQRLARSVLVGHTGSLKLSFYRQGVRLAFEYGRLMTVESWKPTPDDEGSAGFPSLTFLQLLFGYRDLNELRYAFPDCWTENDEAAALLNALFPKQNSEIWAVA
ncbi:MAG: GNAT family N-acetyltransferase [Anaerolineae bacterium]|nr:GNAT family N-acetyltransferase [Thermoflexales bacterium]MDW8406207.1 GNAT family N-acetyltransferase [Anaerolineae bacterium]